MAVGDMLARRDWAALKSYFSARAPADAQEFEARALLALHTGRDSPDWASVVTDLRRASELKPQDALLRVNLAQALLDSQQPRQAHEQAMQAVAMQPDSYPAIEKLALAAAALYRWDEALEVALRARESLGPSRETPTAIARLLAQLQPRWWRPIRAGAIALHRIDMRHSAFLNRTFGNPGFMNHYHRFQGNDEAAARKFVRLAQLPPFQSRRIDWVIEDTSGSPLGLGAFVDIDWPNRRAEILIGFPGDRSNSAALQALVAMLDFCFRRFGIEKVVGYVYGDNPRAQSHAVHFGFKQEGLLRQHIAADGQRIDLYVNALLREEFVADERLQRLCGRWGIGAANSNQKEKG